MGSKLPQVNTNAGKAYIRPCLGRVRTQPGCGVQEPLAPSVNKVWLRKLNEITGVRLKEQIALKGFRSFQISLQMDGVNYQRGVARLVKQVPRGPWCF